jgi:hypothetical protein
MNASYTLLYIKAAMLKKESSAPVSRVLCSYIRYAVMLCSYQT